jgi:hypothetical protein
MKLSIIFQIILPFLGSLPRHGNKTINYPVTYPECMVGQIQKSVLETPRTF